MAKRYFLLLIFFTGILFITPDKAFCIENPEEYLEIEEKFQLKKKESENIIGSLKQKLVDEWMSMTASPFSEPEEQVIIVILRQAVFANSFKYLMIDIPKDFAFQLVKTGFKVGKIMYSGGLGQAIDEFEKITVNEAKEYIMDWLLQNELKYATGNIPFSYTSYTGKNQEVVLPYIIIYQPINEKQGEVAISFFSSKAIEPPKPKGSTATRNTFWYLNEWTEKGNTEFPPFIVRINGKLEKQDNEEYRWVEGPYFEFIFDEPVPEFDFKEPGPVQKIVNNIKENIMVFEKIRKIVEKSSEKAKQDTQKEGKSIFERIKNFIISSFFKAEIGGNILVNQESRENEGQIVQELIEDPPSEEVVAEESSAEEPLVQPPLLEEMQETIDDISEVIDILDSQSQENPQTEEVSEQPQNNSQQSQSNKINQSLAPSETTSYIYQSFSTPGKHNGPSASNNLAITNQEPEETEPELKDEKAPEISFGLLTGEQSSLIFEVNFEIEDLNSIENETPSGLSGFYFRYKKDNGEWIEKEYRNIENYPIRYQAGEQIEGQDGSTYYFQAKAKDREENETDWLPIDPVFTKVNIAKKVLINEIQIDGQEGTGGADDDWVELYNPNEFDVSLNGWSIQKHSKDEPCSAEKSFYKKNFPEEAIIPAKGFYLISDTKADEEIKDLADMTIGWSLSEDNTIYLMDSLEAISASDFSAVVDRVAFGEKSCFSETNPALNPSEEKSIERIEFKDADDNSQDFKINEKPSPTNSKKETLFEPSLADSPWPMFQANNKHSGRSNYSNNISENPGFKELVVSENDSDSFGIPVIGYNGNIYLGAKITKGEKTKEGFYSFDSEGNEKWYFKATMATGSPALYEPNKSVYFFSNNKIYSLNTKNGKLRWKKDLSSVISPVQSPIVSEEGIIYFIAGCKITDGLEDVCLISLDKNGKEQWIYGFLKEGLYENPTLPENPNLTNFSFSISFSPTLSKDNIIYISFKSAIFAFNLDGTNKWKREFESECEYFSCESQAKTPSLDENGKIYLNVRDEEDFKGGTDSGTLSCFHALNSETGEDVWDKKCYKSLSDNPAVISSQGNIFVSSGGGSTYLYSFYPDGTLNWQKEIGGFMDTSFLIADSNETIYKVYRMFSDDFLMAFQNGQKKWHVELKGAGDTIIMSKNGKLIIPGRKLYAIEP